MKLAETKNNLSLAQDLIWNELPSKSPVNGLNQFSHVWLLLPLKVKEAHWALCVFVVLRLLSLDVRDLSSMASPINSSLKRKSYHRYPQTFPMCLNWQVTILYRFLSPLQGIWCHQKPLAYTMLLINIIFPKLIFLLWILLEADLETRTEHKDPIQKVRV